jgi:Calpain large subunit, domain III.
MFSLQQTGGRLPKVKRKYSTYPFAETMEYACAAVFHLEYGKRHLDQFDRNRMTLLTPVKRERENSGRCLLKGGETYVIVPATELPNKHGEFFLSIYVD